jgi:hypothetical protein
MSNYLTPKQRREIEIEELAKYIICILCKLKKEYEQKKTRHQQSNIRENLYEILVSKPSGDTETDDPFSIKFSQTINLLEKRDLIVQISKNSLTYIYLTPAGEQSCLSNYEGIITIDDAKKLVQLLKEKIHNLDPVIEQYYEESLRSWKQDLNIASTICLGAASERAIRCLADAIIDRKPEYKKEIGHSVLSIKAVTDFISGKIMSIFKSVTDDKGFLFTLKDKLEGIARLYRLNRNEAGHPDKVQEINRDEQKNNLYQFRQYIITVFDAINKLK